MRSWRPLCWQGKAVWLLLQERTPSNPFLGLLFCSSSCTAVPCQHIVALPRQGTMFAAALQGPKGVWGTKQLCKSSFDS